jgi:hypothetical protein
MKSASLILFTFFIFLGCTKKKNILETVLATENPLIKKVIKDAEKYEVQILFSQIKRDSLGQPYFVDYNFRLDDATYFYPASTVKMPVAFLALEKLNELEEQGVLIDRNTPYKIEGDTTRYLISKDIIEIFAVSDNEAYNRLFEFLGPDYINAKMQEKGLTPSRFSHRLETDDAANTTTKKISFYIGDSVVYEQSPIVNSAPSSLTLKKIKKGKGFIDKAQLIDNPMDFSLKNQYSLSAMHNSMKQFVKPKKYSKEQQFNLSALDRQFLPVAMSSFPREVKFKDYDPEEYYDSYVKFFMFGDSKDPIQKNISMYNKVGYAYGYLTDCAYITDYKNKIAFIVTATIHVNSNQIFNDNTYEYEEVGIPFLAELGRQLYQQELNQKTKQPTNTIEK